MALMFEPTLAEALSIVNTGKSAAQLAYAGVKLQNGKDEHLISYDLYT